MGFPRPVGGKVVVITGAARGVGEALALNLADEPLPLGPGAVLESEPAALDGAVAPHGWAIVDPLRTGPAGPA